MLIYFKILRFGEVGVFFDRAPLYKLKQYFPFHLARKYKYACYLSAFIICSEKRTVFRERSLSKTVSFEEQVMSKEKYPCIILRQMEAIAFEVQVI